MLRISQYLRAVAGHSPAPRVAKPGSTRAPVVIWNLLRRCNLTCKHCYATSADSEFRNELDTTEALGVIDQLHEAGVRVLILSGGEPCCATTSSSWPTTPATRVSTWPCRPTAR